MRGWQGFTEKLPLPVHGSTAVFHSSFAFFPALGIRTQKVSHSSCVPLNGQPSAALTSERSQFKRKADYASGACGCRASRLEAASLAQTAAAAPRPVGMRVSGVAGGSPPVPAPALPPRSAGQGHVRKEFWVAGDEASVRLAVLDLTGIAMVHGGSNLQFARLRSPLLNFATGIEDSIVQSHNFAFPSAERGSDFVRAAEGVVSTGIGHYSRVRVRIFEPGKLAAPTMAHDLR